jgi:hypothetical protein
MLLKESLMDSEKLMFVKKIKIFLRRSKNNLVRISIESFYLILKTSRISMGIFFLNIFFQRLLQGMETT